MRARVHPQAFVDPSAELADDVAVGAFAVIGAGVVLGPGCTVGASAQVQGPSRFGAGNRIEGHACVGFDPQDLKFAGEETRLEVGERNVFREFCTVHRGTGSGGGLTSIGSDNLFMAYTHVAHDCRIGDHTIFSNAGTLAGHVEVGDWAVIGAFSSVHQFTRVGRHAYIGGYSVITQDALPYAKTVGLKAAYYGPNRIGLERRGFDPAAIERIESSLRLLTRSRLHTPDAVARIREEHGGHEEIEHLLEFIETSERGILKSLPGRRGSRGAG